jgi:hypothetical protein
MDLGRGLLIGLGIGLGAADRIGIDDEAAFLAPADASADDHRLLECHPDGCCVALGHRLGPQHEDVDALIADAVMALGPHDAACHALRAPRLHPWPHAFFEFAYDLIRDPLMDLVAHDGRLNR